MQVVNVYCLFYCSGALTVYFHLFQLCFGPLGVARPWHKPSSCCMQLLFVGMLCKTCQRDVTLPMNDLYFPLFVSTCFRLSPVHHQEHHLINCIKHWYVRVIRRVQLLCGCRKESFLYNVLVRSCYQGSLAVAWMYIHTTARLACTNVPMLYTFYEMMLVMMDWWQSETCRAN